MTVYRSYGTGLESLRRFFGRMSLFAIVWMLCLSGTFMGTAAAASQLYNGCSNDLAGSVSAACPTAGDAALYIESVRSVPGGVSIRLTPSGIPLGTTCDGAAWIVLMASGVYASIPADQRAYTDLIWADPYITSEVMGHAVAAATNIPQLVAHGNPIDIVFADYSTPGSQGLFWRSLDDPTQVFSPGTCTGNSI